jgi:hypothetical protein
MYSSGTLNVLNKNDKQTKQQQHNTTRDSQCHHAQHRCHRRRLTLATLFVPLVDAHRPHYKAHDKSIKRRVAPPASITTRLNRQHYAMDLYDSEAFVVGRPAFRARPA